MFDYMKLKIDMRQNVDVILSFDKIKRKKRRVDVSPGIRQLIYLILNKIQRT